MLDQGIFLLPERIVFNENLEDFSDYFEEVFQIFKRDFIETKPAFRGREVRLLPRPGPSIDKYPLLKGKGYNFYHITHQGDDEENRQLCLHRTERVPWPAPMIDRSEHPYLKVWKRKKQGKNKIFIMHDLENYLVVLEDRKTYLYKITSFIFYRKDYRDTLLSEYRKYKI